ncbi:MAG: glycosyltransferase [Phycisphaerae bacterium]|nr:glycosyltransferase [Phycisphaerae bacterium]
MAATAIALTGTMALILLLWVSRHILISRQRGRGAGLGSDAPPVRAPAPRISVIVAAKDEAENIESCLRSLLQQDYPNVEIIVCNDRSADATGRIAERLAGEDGRLRVLHIETLPSGWCGKNHAIRRGADAADGDWLLTVDADCRLLTPRALSVAMRHARDTGAEMLSVLPMMETGGFWEEVIQPVCSGVMMIWFNPDKVNDASRRTAYANGAFMLIRRECYDAVGTHEAIRGEVMEDLQLARRVKQAGRTLRVVQGSGIYRVRMYRTLAGTLAGWCRIFHGAFRTPGRLLASLGMLLLGLVPYGVAAIALTLAATGAEATAAWWACGLTAAAAAAMQLSVIYRFYALTGARRCVFWTYPLGSLIAAGVVLWALGKLRPGARLTWRGTSYNAGRTAPDHEGKAA